LFRYRHTVFVVLSVIACPGRRLCPKEPSYGADGCLCASSSQASDYIRKSHQKRVSLKPSPVAKRLRCVHIIAYNILCLTQTQSFVTICLLS